MLKKYILFLLAFVLIFPMLTFSQVSPDHYLINFKDKKGSKYSISKPQEFLSQRAIDRRVRYKIPIDEKDLPVNQNYLDGLKALGLQIVNVSKWTNSVTVYSTDSLLMDTIQKRLPYIKSLGFKKVKRELANKNLVNKSSINKFGIQSVDSVVAVKYGPSFNQIKIHNGQLLHQEGFQGQGMQIAILDGGFYHVDKLPAFDSIRINKQILGTRDFVKDGKLIYEAADHGMKVLSTMAGNIPNQLLGTAPKAKYWLLRSEQTESEFLIEEHNWIAAAEFADSVGVDVINSSLGYNLFDDSTENHSYSEMDGNTALVTIGADIAASKGILVVNSAGNEGNDAWHFMTAPADADSILAVGAITYDRRLAYFSSLGPTSDSRIKPDVCAIGLSPVVSSTSGGITYSSGTSFSSPIMAGLVTCLWQAHRDLNNMEIIDLVRRSSDRYNNPDNSFGYGIPDIYAAHLFEKTSGSIEMPIKGWINAFPNPFKDEFYVEFLSQIIHVPYNLRIQLFNIQGKVLRDKQLNGLNNNFSFNIIDDVSDIASGVYVLRLTTGNLSFEKKLIKQ